MVFWCNFDFAPFCLPEIDTHIWKQWGTGRQLADEQRSYCWVDVHRDSDSPSHSDGSALDNQSRKKIRESQFLCAVFFFCCCCWISVTLPGLQLSQSSASFFTKGKASRLPPHHWRWSSRETMESVGLRSLAGFGSRSCPWQAIATPKKSKRQYNPTENIWQCVKTLYPWWTSK